MKGRPKWKRGDSSRRRIAAEGAISVCPVPGFQFVTVRSGNSVTVHSSWVATEILVEVMASILDIPKIAARHHAICSLIMLWNESHPDQAIDIGDFVWPEHIIPHANVRRMVEKWKNKMPGKPGTP